MKKVKIILSGLVLVFGFSIINIQNVSAACADGHSSSGNQGWGGPNGGRWELSCDQATSAVCCVSHPKPIQ
jgi:hypothetical protein